MYLDQTLKLTQFKRQRHDKKTRMRTLKQRHAASRWSFVHKTIYGYVAVPLPSYVIPLTRASRNYHSLAYIHTYRHLIELTTTVFISSSHIRSVKHLPKLIATLTDPGSFEWTVSQVCHLKHCCFYLHCSFSTVP